MSIVSINFDKIWSKFVLNLRVEHPFFSAVALFAKLEFINDLEVARTENKKLYVSTTFFQSLSESQCFSYLLHQVIHLALNHPNRSDQRDEKLWNVACDIVVNNIIDESTSWPIAPHTAWDFSCRGQSAERVYANLQELERQNIEQSIKNSTASKIDQKSDSYVGGGLGTGNDFSKDIGDQGDRESGGRAPSESIHNNSLNEKSPYDNVVEKYKAVPDFKVHKIDATESAQEYWRNAMVQARQQLKQTNQYSLNSSTLQREVDVNIGGLLSWQDMLWKYAVPSANNYAEFDARFIYRSLFIEYLQSEELIVEIVIDTSGSICETVLSVFISEMLAISLCHPDVKINFYYVDCEMHGPYGIPIDFNDLPVPLGSGGTSFKPFFKKLEENSSLMEQPQAVIYFTDGFAEFPNFTPEVPVLWVVTESGAEDKEFPFGEIVRIRG